MREYHLFKPLIDIEASIGAVEGVLRSGFINEGSQVLELTERVQNILESDRLILLNSCTSALTLALKLSGAGHGDDVVTTSMTCVATNMPIKHVGSNIIWADVNPETGMLTPDTIRSVLTESTKAVIVVLWAGNCPQIDEIYDLCKERGVKLIVDAAHGFLAGFNNRQIHNFADYTCYSFQAIKHFTTGDGGALVCSSDYDFLQSKKMKWFGLDRDRAKDEKGNWKGQQWDVDIDTYGYKFNMNNISAAIGLANLDKAKGALSAHRENASYLDSAFKGIDFARPLLKAPGENGSSWVYTVVLDKNLAPVRDQILEKINLRGVKAGVVHVPNHHYTCFKGEMTNLPGVDSFFSRQISLPCGWWLSREDMSEIFSIFKESVREFCV